MFQRLGRDCFLLFPLLAGSEEGEQACYQKDVCFHGFPMFVYMSIYCFKVRNNFNWTKVCLGISCLIIQIQTQADGIMTESGKIVSESNGIVP